MLPSFRCRFFPIFGFPRRQSFSNLRTPLSSGMSSILSRLRILLLTPPLPHCSHCLPYSRRAPAFETKNPPTNTRAVNRIWVEEFSALRANVELAAECHRHRDLSSQYCVQAGPDAQTKLHAARPLVLR